MVSDQNIPVHRPQLFFQIPLPISSSASAAPNPVWAVTAWVPPSFDRLLIIKWLIQEVFFFLSVFLSDTLYSDQHFSGHLISDVFRLRCTGCYHISWNYLHIPYLYRLDTAKSQLIQHLKCRDQILIKTDLEGCLFQSILA